MTSPPAGGGNTGIEELRAFATARGWIVVERGDGRVEVVLGARRARGRPRVEVDVEAARELVRQGLGLRKVAAALGVRVGTLRRRLGEQPAPT